MRRPAAEYASGFPTRPVAESMGAMTQTTAVTAWSRGWRGVTVATLAVAVIGLGVSGVWFAQAWTSPSSTAAVGLVLAALLGLPMLLGATLASAALLTTRWRPAGARVPAAFAVIIVWGALMMLALLLVPGWIPG